MKIQYHNRRRLSREDEAEYHASYCPTLSALLSTSDVISISCPLNADTTDLISHAEFAAMRQGTYLVNTARGPIVNEAALIQALESGKIERAGLDVFVDEPNVN